MKTALSVDALIQLRDRLRAEAKRLYQEQEEIRWLADGVLDDATQRNQTADLIDALLDEERELAKAREHVGSTVRLVKGAA